MKRSSFLTIGLLVSLLAPHLAVSAEPLALELLQGMNLPSGVVPGAYIVTLKSGKNVSSFVSAHHLNPRAVFEHALRGVAVSLSDTDVLALKADPDVLAIEADRIVTLDAAPSLPVLTGMAPVAPKAFTFSIFAAPKPSQTVPTGIKRAGGLLSPTAKIDGSDQRVNVDVAVIDTGVQRTHPDLNVVSQVNFSTDFTADDQNGHGTHVAGTIAALDNTAGVVGMAPGARIWSVKVLNRQGSGYLSDIVRGIDYVTQNANKIAVANMSLGCECASPAMDTAINNAVAAGVVFAVAAGNSAKDASTFSPANNPNVITVSALADYNGLPGGGAAATCYTDVDDTLANFSNMGSLVEIAAPGVCIYSTWKGSSYNTISGTSMASPHVAGAAALYIATHGKPVDSAGALAVRQALINAATPQADSAGFTGDFDAFPEPLLNVAGF